MQPGITTDEIDKAVHKMIVDNGAYPSPLTYGESYIPTLCEMHNDTFSNPHLLLLSLALSWMLCYMHAHSTLLNVR